MDGKQFKKKGTQKQLTERGGLTNPLTIKAIKLELGGNGQVDPKGRLHISDKEESWKTKPVPESKTCSHWRYCCLFTGV